MITEWRVANFKSIQKQTSLSFGPLTIFCGKNSSGKSTIIQSLLLVSQTLASKVGAHSVVLNGQLAKLGQMDDIRSFGSADPGISIGWDCRPRRAIDPLASASESRFIAEERPLREPELLRCDIRFSSDSTNQSLEQRQLHPQLESLSFALTGAHSRNGDERAASVLVRKIPDAELGSKLESVFGLQLTDAPLQALLYDIGLDEDSMSELLEDFVTGSTIGCSLRHFLPYKIALRTEPQLEFSEAVIQELLGARPVRTPRRVRFRDWQLPPELLALLQSTLPEKLKGVLPVAQTARYTLDDFRMAKTRLPSQETLQLRHHLLNMESTIREMLSRSQDENQFELIQRRLPRLIAAGFDYFDDYFSNSIQYLGPLRDEPKALYPIATTIDPSDVGIKGENTAAVLDLHQYKLIQHIPPSSFSVDAVSRLSESVPLRNAIVKWLQYLEIGSDVSTTDRGKFGHDLRVHPIDSSQPHELTHLGVGVSQILPILVACLLADGDSLIVIEQPELHLHPRVQSRLADFFLSMALSGKQCVIETHSEYIIGRIRKRIADAIGDEIQQKTKLYFTEKSGGQTSFTQININEFGAISNWPDGFFDEAQSEAEGLLRTAAQKRRNQRRP